MGCAHEPNAGAEINFYSSNNGNKGTRPTTFTNCSNRSDRKESNTQKEFTSVDRA